MFFLKCSNGVKPKRTLAWLIFGWRTHNNASTKDFSTGHVCLVWKWLLDKKAMYQRDAFTLCSQWKITWHQSERLEYNGTWGAIRIVFFFESDSVFIVDHKRWIIKLLTAINISYAEPLYIILFTTRFLSGNMYSYEYKIRHYFPIDFFWLSILITFRCLEDN